jgi:hypothetical protein
MKILSPLVLACVLTLPALAAERFPEIPPAEMSHEQSCGQQADRQFDKQNRYLMSEQDQSATPFSSSGVIGDTSHGLDDQYRRDRMVDDCLHSAP